MLDLGASINVMPYSVYASINLGELKNDGVIIQLANRSNAYLKGVLEDVLVQVDHLIFPANFYVLDMEDSTQSSPSPILLERHFMKITQTKIDVAKGALIMAFGGDMIHFKIPESIENPNDVRSCFSIDVIKDIGQERSTPIKRDEFRNTNEEGIGVKHKEHAPTLIPLNLAKSTPCSSVPNRMQASGNNYIDFRKQNATIRKDDYPLPFIDPLHEYFEEHVVEEIPLHAVSPNEA
ncbi:hypothetical protein TB2_034092 [Malus domestica]